ncbi:MAG TPA: glycerol-3-phosphate dehydrogenase/oxidase [Azospira sp.]|nr:glycerol-3-phosphate dehydrogenase/oxidase [Azospira sp.]
MGATRAEALDRLRNEPCWDVLIVGGGATGLGCAVDAATRGYRTLLLERGDYACGTSSRSTKLIHGGVRYLRQGDLALVRHALIERSRLLANAAPLVRPLPFVIPASSTLDWLRYAAGLKLYDLLAGARNIEASRALDRRQLLAELPGLQAGALVGGVRYWDAQFDDARLAVALMRTAVGHGATCLNYLPVRGFLKAAGGIRGVHAEDAESGECFELRARIVINAAGVYADRVRQLDDPAAAALLAPSQGIHLVVDAGFLPGNGALLVPETEDGRVVFAIPWQGRLLLGTTDTARDDLPDEPQPFAEEVDFLLRTVAGVLAAPPQRRDIRSAFAGLRPLLDPLRSGSGGNRAARPAALSREHALQVDASGLLTVTGGKWTTYRWMAEQVIDRAAVLAGLPAAVCATRELRLHGCDAVPDSGPYGSEAGLLAALPGATVALHPELPHSEAMVRFALRHEGARTIEDVLARRTRALFVDAAAAAAAIPRVAEIVAEELAPTPERLAAMRRAAEASARRFLLAGGGRLGEGVGRERSGGRRPRSAGAEARRYQPPNSGGVMPSRSISSSTFRRSMSRPCSVSRGLSAISPSRCWARQWWMAAWSATSTPQSSA